MKSGVNREVRESTRVVLGDIPQTGLVQYSLDSCLLLSSFFARSPPVKPPSLNADLHWLPIKAAQPYIWSEWALGRSTALASNCSLTSHGWLLLGRIPSSTCCLCHIVMHMVIYIYIYIYMWLYNHMYIYIYIHTQRIICTYTWHVWLPMDRESEIERGSERERERERERCCCTLYSYTHAHAYIYTHIYVYVYIYIYYRYNICLYIHIYIYIHIHKQV